MKTNSRVFPTGTAILAAAALFFSMNSNAIPPRSVAQAAAEDKDDGAAPAEAGIQKERIKIERIEPVTDEEHVSKSAAWLGVSTIEASEALASQLDLQPGVGLVVTYVVAESP